MMFCFKRGLRSSRNHPNDTHDVSRHCPFPSHDPSPRVGWNHSLRVPINGWTKGRRSKHLMEPQNHERGGVFYALWVGCPSKSSKRRSERLLFETACVMFSFRDVFTIENVLKTPTFCPRSVRISKRCGLVYPWPQCRFYAILSSHSCVLWVC